MPSHNMTTVVKVTSGSTSNQQNPSGSSYSNFGDTTTILQPQVLYKDESSLIESEKIDDASKYSAAGLKWPKWKSESDRVQNGY